MDYRQFCDLGSYVFEMVGPRFRKQGTLSAFDFFCIVIWKANRAKTAVARRIRNRGGENIEKAVRTLTKEIARLKSPQERMRHLIKGWGFRLPMASAILTVLYPEDFTVYDTRVCRELGAFQDLDNTKRFEAIWRGYEEFKAAVEKRGVAGSSLRDRDRWLWGKSFQRDLKEALRQNFVQAPGR